MLSYNQKKSKYDLIKIKIERNINVQTLRK